MCIPASSAEAERDFSAAGILTEHQQACLSAKHLNAMLSWQEHGHHEQAVTGDTHRERGGRLWLSTGPATSSLTSNRVGGRRR